jgi:uncharacterized protein (TIGR00290 family)
MTKQPVILAWSGGKDSSLMLQALAQSAEYRPAMLLTTLTEEFQRISMHGVRQELLHAQADSLGLKLHEVWIPWPCANGVYEVRMQEACLQLKAQGLEVFAFGDLFLEEVRAYREENMKKAGMQAIYPLWGRETGALARRFIDEGFKAKLCCVDSAQIDASFAGREYDAQLLAELPAGADPCGENGEFHTFVYDGPVFKRPVACRAGEVVARGQFVYADLVAG